jgi:phosphoribosylamine--glycine ligase
MASGGYPGTYASGFRIDGIDNAGDVTVFHAGTAVSEGRLVTAGGRVLGVTGTGAGLGEALERAYAAVRGITFEGAFWREDIGAV